MPVVFPSRLSPTRFRPHGKLRGGPHFTPNACSNRARNREKRWNPISGGEKSSCRISSGSLQAIRIARRATVLHITRSRDHVPISSGLLDFGDWLTLRQ